MVLTINATKTLEMLFTNKRDNPLPSPVSIHENNIEKVTEYRYWAELRDKHYCVVDKAAERLYIIKRLCCINTSDHTIKLTYTVFIESVLSDNLPDDKKLPTHTISTAGRLSGGQLDCKTIIEFYDARFMTKCSRNFHSEDPAIIPDKLPSGRCQVPEHRAIVRRDCLRKLTVRLYSFLFYR